MKLNTPEDRSQWWNNLSEPWKLAIEQSYLKPEISGKSPDDNWLSDFLTTPVIRIVGSSAPYPTTDQLLDDLKPLSVFGQLEHLFVTHVGLKSLDGIGALKTLKSLFVHNNDLTHINDISHLTNLEELYIQHNQIKSLMPVQKLIKLHTLYCVRNAFDNLEGITPQHESHLKRFICLPNEGISFREINRVQADYGIECKKG